MAIHSWGFAGLDRAAAPELEEVLAVRAARHADVEHLRYARRSHAVLAQAES